MNRLTLVFLLALAAVALGAEGKTDPVRIPAIVDLENTACPISGEKVDGETFTDWNGVRVHFCCPGCDKKFKKSPAKYADKLGIELIKDGKKTLVDVRNPKCPVMGGKTKDSVHADFGSVRIHYCCPGCDKKARAEPAEAFESLGFGYLPEVIDLRNPKCPVMGGKTGTGEKDVSIDHEGIRVHFCCPGCIKKFSADPDRHFRDLGVDPAKLKAGLK